jgi:2-dehydropantoate 2-reductase
MLAKPGRKRQGEDVNPSPPAKIAVVGAGAIGSVLGALLARAGEDVTLIGRHRHVEAIRQHGLRIDGIQGTLTIQVDAREVLGVRPELVLLAVKAQDVEAACREIAPQATGVPLVALQNGLRSDETAASILGRENLIRCVVFFDALYLEPGNVTYLAEGSLVLGQSDANGQAQVEQIQQRLEPVISTTISDNIVGAKWTKLLTNAMGNSIDAMTGMSLSACMQHVSLQRIGVRIMREGLAVARGAGVRLESLPGLSLFALKTMLRAPLPIAASALGRAAGEGRSADSLTSTLQSLRRGKPTEIDYLNGEIVRVGREVGVPTPCNAKAVELVHEVERTGQFFSPDEVERRFAAC